jgi:hypothetical protein
MADAEHARGLLQIHLIITCGEPENLPVQVVA